MVDLEEIGQRGINMVDLEETGQVERIFKNYMIDSQLINIEKLLQPALPPIKKGAKTQQLKKETGLEKSVLEEVNNGTVSR